MMMEGTILPPGSATNSQLVQQTPVVLLSRTTSSLNGTNNSTTTTVAATATTPTETPSKPTKSQSKAAKLKNMARAPSVINNDPNILIMDNGAYTMKIGTAADAKPRIIPNCITKVKSERKRPFIGDQMSQIFDMSGMYFLLPFNKGYLTNPDTQKTIWDYVFGSECLDLQNPSDMTLLVTEPQFNFRSLQEFMCEIFFEDYEFGGLCRTTGGHLADFKYSKTPESICSLVIDSGYSFTHVIPFINGQKVSESVVRVSMGGKALTNHLKELISYRQIYVMDETHMMNQVKENCCFVTSKYEEDLAISKLKLPQNTIAQDFVLPDYANVKTGYIRDSSLLGKPPRENEQILRLNNERFSVPELLFNPADVGMAREGISDVIIDVVEGFPESVKPHFYSNIILTGGNCLFPGFKERLYNDIRANCSTEFDVNITLPSDPITYNWEGGREFVHDPEFSRFVVSRSMYHEKGLNAFISCSDINN